MANMGYLGVGSWFLTYLVTFENVFYLYSVYSDRWDIKGTYNYPKNTHNYPGYGYISKFYPSLDTPGYPLSIEVCLDLRLGFTVFRPFCHIVLSLLSMQRYFRYKTETKGKFIVHPMGWVTKVWENKTRASITPGNHLDENLIVVNDLIFKIT